VLLTLTLIYIFQLYLVRTLEATAVAVLAVVVAVAHHWDECIVYIDIYNNTCIYICIQEHYTCMHVHACRKPYGNMHVSLSLARPPSSPTCGSSGRERAPIETTCGPLPLFRLLRGNTNR
jgi:hypothetical protein